MVSAGVHSSHTHHSVSYTSLLWSLSILVFFAALSLAFYYGFFTGYAGLSLHADSLAAGETVKGNVIYDLKKGPLPLETEVTLSVNGYEKSLPLSALVNNNIISEHLTSVQFAPLLKVTVQFKRAQVRVGGSANRFGDVPSFDDSPAGGDEDSGISGGVILEPPIPADYYKTYYIKSGSVVKEPLDITETASVYEVRLAESNALIESSSVSLRRAGEAFSLSTSYSDMVQGFSASGDFTSLSLDLAPFLFSLSKHTQSPASLAISFRYHDDEFVQVRDTFPVQLDTSSSILPSFDLEDPLSEDSSTVRLPGSEMGDGSSPLPPSSCDAPSCTPYGSCAIPPLGRSGSHKLGISYVRTRHCLCEDGSSYIEEQACYGINEQSQDVHVASQTAASSGSHHLIPHPPRDASAPLLPPLEHSTSSRTWTTTYAFNDRSFSVAGGIAQALAEHERLELPVGNSRHSVGVVSIDYTSSTPRVLIEVESTPQQFYVSLGQTYTVDVTGDARDDLAITFASLTTTRRAVIKVTSLAFSSLSLLLQPGDRLATVLTVPEELPVAYVILNNELPSLRVFFVQSSNSLPFTCFDSIQNGDETGIDCGGSCSLCNEERFFYAPLVSWLVVIALFVMLGFVTRRRFSR